ncbi:MAG: DUF4349 domain-containing protein [Bacteroidota bacterium]
MKIFSLLSLIIMASTCGGGGTYDSETTTADTETYTAATAKVTDFSSTESKQLSDRKMIWTGAVEVKVDQVNEATTKVNELCKRYNAFVSKMELNNSNYEITNDITIRVEGNNFETLLEELKGLGSYVRKVSISSNDVTEQYVDVTSRLQTKKEVRERYIAILKNKTGKISEVLEAEEAIRKITEEIEAKEGQLRVLEDRIKYSTIQLTVYETVTFKKEPERYEKRFWDKMVKALSNGWSIVTGFVLVLFSVWPLIIVGGFLLWKWGWFKKRFSRKSKKDGN